MAGALLTTLCTPSIASHLPCSLPRRWQSQHKCPTSVSTEGVRHELSKVDADAWLDGFMPYALRQDEVAGAEVVIVNDGQVLTERGFVRVDLYASHANRSADQRQLRRRRRAAEHAAQRNADNPQQHTTHQGHAGMNGPEQRGR